MDSDGPSRCLEATDAAAEQQKRQLLKKKIQKMKLQKNKSNPHWLKPKKYRNTDVQAVIEAHYKKRLAKYKETNTQLAHVVADQKLEIAHWYNESVTLKSENQALQEKLLRYNNLQHDEIIDEEVESRILERCASLNQAVNSSMNSFLEAVEGISKVKELVGTIAKSSRRSKIVPNVSSTPPTVSGDSSSESVMRSTNDGGEKNSPSFQKPTKLTHMWRQRQQDRVQAAETPDMSVIGEQSTILDDTRNISAADDASNSAIAELSEVSQMEDKDLVNMNIVPCEDVLNVSNENDVNDDERKREQLLIQDTNTEVKKRISTIPLIEEDILPDIKGKAANRLEDSPGQLPKVRSSRRSSLRGRRVSWAPIEDRGATMESRGSKMRKSSILHLKLDLSSDFEDDTSENPEPDKKILGENVSLSESIISSPRASPATMLSRLEELENKGGRKGKRSRSKSLVSSTNGDEPILTGTLKLPEDDDDCLLMPPPTISPTPKVFKPVQSSFLIADNDLTLNEQLDMSMSDSVSNAIIVAKEESMSDIIYETKDNCKGSKKFFQHPLAQENSTKKEIRKTLNKNTPYDLSLMEETSASIVPYTSKEDLKENCPPSATTHTKKSENDNEKQTQVRRCSIILSDLNSPHSKDILSPELVLSPGGRFSLVSPIDKIRTSINRKKSLFVSQAESNSFDSPKLGEEKDMCKPKDIEGNLNSYDDTQKHKKNELPTKKSLKSRPSLSLKSMKRKSEIKQENESVCSTTGRRRTQVKYIEQNLDSSCDISISDDGDESWIKTPLKKKKSSDKSLNKSHAKKSIGASRQSLTSAKIAEASENSQATEKQNIMKNRKSRSKKSLKEDKSAGDNDAVKPELTNKALSIAPEQPSTEPNQGLTTKERQNTKKGRGSRSKKSKLNEDTSANASDKPEFPDKAVTTGSKHNSTKPEPSITASERKSTENLKERVENRSKKEDSTSLQAPCISNVELPVMKSTSGTERNDKLVSEEDDTAEKRKNADNVQLHKDASERPSPGEKRPVTEKEVEDNPRKRRTACKNITFKEPKLNQKMRR